MLHIIDNFYLKIADKYNFILIEKVISSSGKNKGKEIEKPIGYYGRIQNVLSHVLNISIRSSSDSLNAKVILDKVLLLEERINSLKIEHISKLFEEYCKEKNNG